MVGTGLPLVAKQSAACLQSCRLVQIYASRDHQAEASMDLGFILLGLVGLALVLAFMHVLNQMASERDRAARRNRKRSEKPIVPFSDDTVTHLGHS